MKNFVAISLLLITAFFLSACQEENTAVDDPANKAGKSGKVAIVLTDDPNHEFSEINLTMTKITLLRDDDDDEDSEDNVVIFEGEETINLLALEYYSHLFALSSDVPVGSYHKIRLTLKKENGIELVKTDESGEVIEKHYPKLTGNAKLDLNPKKPFEVVTDQTLFIQLDIDAKKSINIVETGNGKYQFRPVVFVDVISDTFTGKLVRHTGYVRNLDMTGQFFNLCPTLLDEESINETTLPELCLHVDIMEASLFDDMGDTITADSLGNNQSVTAIGYLKNYHAKTVGMIEFGKLVAQVVHAGNQENFSEIDGEASTEIDETDNSFTLTVDAETDVSVLLHSETRVFLRNGTATTVDQIFVGRKMEVHGVFESDESSPLKATLVILDPVKEGSVKLSGEVLAVNPETNSITMTTESGDQTVYLTSETVLLAVDTSDDSAFSKIISLDDIETEDRIEVYGKNDGTGVIEADIVLIVSE